VAAKVQGREIHIGEAHGAFYFVDPLTGEKQDGAVGIDTLHRRTAARAMAQTMALGPGHKVRYSCLIGTFLFNRHAPLQFTTAS